MCCPPGVFFQYWENQFGKACKGKCIDIRFDEDFEWLYQAKPGDLAVFTHCISDINITIKNMYCFT